MIRQLFVMSVALGLSSPVMGMCEAGQNAFAETTHQLIRQQGECVVCHGGNGPGPGFAVENVEESYTRFKNYVNFSDMESSFVVEELAAGHCTTCTVTADQMLESIQEWHANGEDQCPSDYRYSTSEVQLPDDLPDRTEGFRQITWDLGSIRQGLAGTVFAVEVQQYIEATDDAPGAYRLRNPRIVAGDKPLRIQGVKLLVNRTFDPGADVYGFVDALVSPQEGAPTDDPDRPAPPYPILSADTMIVEQQIREGDSFSIGFQTLEEAEIESCASVDRFRELVMPVVAARNCAHCHGGAESEGIFPANYHFYMNLDDEALCRAFLQRGNISAVDESVLIALPAGATAIHPQIFTATDIIEVRRLWGEWLANEYLQW